MDIRSALKSQYHAALKTVRQVIERCPDALWLEDDVHQAPLWRVAYHTIFFAHYYTQKSHLNLVAPWPNHDENLVHLGRVKDGVRTPPPAAAAWTKPQILDMLRIVEDRIDADLDALDLEADQCGFPWYKMSTFEHQLVNLRHAQHHAAAMAARLRQAGVQTDWIGKG